MNKQIEALKIEQEVLLTERLRKVPENARLIVDSADGMSSSVYPVGYLCHKAAEALAEAEKQDDIEKQLDYAHARGFKEGAENAYKKMEHSTQEPVAWMEEYQSCKVNEDERLCHSDKVFRLVQLLASQLGECQSLCAKYAEETVKNGEQKLKEVTAIKEVLAEAEKQEPVAWMSENAMNVTRFKDIAQHWINNGGKAIPLYTHPATWQSLSDDEIEKIQLANGGSYKSVSFARAIEQALKEKNNA